MSPVSSLAQYFIAKPKILSGELISGYIARISPFAAQGGIDMTLRYQNKPRHHLSWLFPSGLQQVAQLYGSSVPSAEALLEEHTVFPLLRPFLPEDVVGSLRSHFLANPVPGIAAACGFASMGLSSRWALAVCAQCVADDGGHGFGHWRTAHFVPGLALCAFHFEPLLTYCNQCKSGFRHSREAWLPHSKCLCGQELQQVRPLATKMEYRVEAAIAKMARQILTGEVLSTVRNAELLLAISRRAKRLGHGGPGGVIRIINLIEQKVGRRTLDTYQLSTGAKTVFRQSLAGAFLLRNPIQNLLLIHALFDGMEDLADSLSSNAETLPDLHFHKNVAQVIRRRQRPDRYRHWYLKTEEELQELRCKFRSLLLSMKSETPNLKRYQLRRLGAREAYAFFCRFDKEWLDETLPCSPSFPTSSASRRSLQARRDHLLATHIRIRHELLMRSSSPFRITHRRLLEGHSLQTVAKKHFEQLPRTKLALAECTESLEEWRLRQVRALLNQAFDTSAKAPFQRNLDLSHLSFNQIKQLKEKIQKWLKRQMSKS
jgi:hypothetical protein